MFLAPDTLFHDRYRVVRGLKVGGMGAVYEVIDQATQSRRALKLLLPEMLESGDLRRRFEREATITGAIESDHVVRITDAGFDDATGMPFLAMELLRGEELAAVIARRGPLPPEEAMLYLRHIALGLDKVHAAGIVHRDLKPENLFVVQRDDGSPCVKLIDFGVAKSVAPVASAVKKTRAIGTPLFMSPEQIRGDGHIGPRADLYALGHLAYMLLVGEAYWTEETATANSLEAFVDRVARGAGELPSARVLRRQGLALPPAFDAWFRQATATTPEERFGGPIEAVSALAVSLDLPAEAPRAPIVSRAPSDAPAPFGMAGAARVPSASIGRTPRPVSTPPTPTGSAFTTGGAAAPVARAGSRRILVATAASLVLVAAVVALGLRSRAPDRGASDPQADRDATPRPASVPPQPTAVAPVVTSADVASAQPLDPPPLASSAASQAQSSPPPSSSQRPSQQQPAPPRPGDKNSPARPYPGID